MINGTGNALDNVSWQFGGQCAERVRRGSPIIAANDIIIRAAGGQDRHEVQIRTTTLLTNRDLTLTRTSAINSSSNVADNIIQQFSHC